MSVNRSDFAGWTYKQTGAQCVLAAYAAALWPVSQQPAADYFQAYAEHFKLLAAGRSLDEVYDDDFHDRAAVTPGGAFGIVHCLHFASSELAFSRARTQASLTFFPDGAAAWKSIELVLGGAKRAVASVFINDNPGSPFARMHAIAVARDNGLYAYDSNQGIVDLPHGKPQLGLLGHAFLVAEV